MTIYRNGGENATHTEITFADDDFSAVAVHVAVQKYIRTLSGRTRDYRRHRRRRRRRRHRRSRVAHSRQWKTSRDPPACFSHLRASSCDYTLFCSRARPRPLSLRVCFFPRSTLSQYTYYLYIFCLSISLSLFSTHVLNMSYVTVSSSSRWTLLLLVLLASNDGSRLRVIYCCTFNAYYNRKYSFKHKIWHVSRIFGIRIPFRQHFTDI